MQFLTEFKQSLSKKYNQWAMKRAGKTREMTLTIRNVYIFLSREGIFYALLLFITFVAGINYANNLVLGLCFLLGSLFIITVHYTFAHLSNLQIKLIDISNTQVGGLVQVRLQVSSHAKQPHRQIRFSFNKSAFSINQPLKKDGNFSQDMSQNHDFLLVNQIKEPQIISLYLTANQRGYFELPRLTVSTVYPLGILQAWSYVFFDGNSWVFPAPLAYEMKASQFVMSDDEQQASLQTKSGQEDFDQLDNYVVGESLARISWSHLARGQGLLAKRFVDNVGQQQLLDYYQMPAVTHEEKLSQLRYGVDKLAEQQIAFCLRLPDGDGVLGQGRAFVEESLLRLAKTP